MPGTYASFRDIPRFTEEGDYEIAVGWSSIESTLEDFGQGHGIDMDPEFQRQHVWTEEQQVRYVEFVLRGGASSRVIHFNKSAWMGRGVERGEPLVLVDGKQRLEAVRRFMKGEIAAFGSYIHEYEDKPDRITCRFTFKVNTLETYGEVLQWYLDLNDGGVAHSKEELDRVRALKAALPE
jgi:hypothetical protein